jgi:predicted DNA-binding protein (MmcQ/YjbR family)
MTTEDICEICRSLPHVTEDVKWDNDLVFSVAGKMFCAVELTEEAFGGFGFKTSPENFARLLERDGIIPAPYLARAQWVSVETPDGLSLDEARELLAEAWRLVVEKLPKRVQAELGIGYWVLGLRP